MDAKPLLVTVDTDGHARFSSQPGARLHKHFLLSGLFLRAAAYDEHPIENKNEDGPSGSQKSFGCPGPLDQLRGCQLLP